LSIIRTTNFVEKTEKERMCRWSWQISH
jgi:hypothetical protein